MNIFLLYDYIIDRDVMNDSPPQMIHSPVGRIVYHFPPFIKSPSECVLHIDAYSEGLFPFFIAKWILQSKNLMNIIEEVLMNFMHQNL